jgi:hypothetical protein
MLAPGRFYLDLLFAIRTSPSFALVGHDPYLHSRRLGRCLPGTHSEVPTGYATAWLGFVVRRMTRRRSPYRRPDGDEPLITRIG